MSGPGVRRAMLRPERFSGRAVCAGGVEGRPPGVDVPELVRVASEGRSGEDALLS